MDDAQNTERTLSSAETFADRIKMLIRQVGSVTQIARMCGFSEGVVRSWRDGHTDPSRARCVTLARALGLSLIWVVAGEGSPALDRITTAAEAQGSEEVLSAPDARRIPVGKAIAGAAVVDRQRLDTAVRMLQSELSLTENPLILAENTDLLSRLYEILGPGGAQMDAHAMVEFNQQLGERIRMARRLG